MCPADMSVEVVGLLRPTMRLWWREAAWGSSLECIGKALHMLWTRAVEMRTTLSSHSWAFKCCTRSTASAGILYFADQVGSLVKQRGLKIAFF